MKILSIPTLGILSLTLAGCIGKEQPFDIDPAICDHHPGEYGCPAADSSESSTPVVVSSSSTPVVVSSSSTPVVVSSSSTPVVVSSSSTPVVVSSSSTPVVVSSSSAPIVVISSSSAPTESSSSAPAVSSSSAPAVNIEDLSFTETLNEDQSIEVDAVANLSEAFINLIDKDAFDSFYLDLVAQGLDEAAIAKAVAALTPVGTAIGADFIYQLSGDYIIPIPEGINLTATSEEAGFGIIYHYSVNQKIDDVDVVLDIELQFPNSQPGANIRKNDETGVTTYTVGLNGLVVMVNELKLDTSDVAIALDTTNPLLAFKGGVRVVADLAADGNIASINFLSAALDVNLKGSVVNGIIGVDGNAEGTIDGLDVQIDMAADTATVGVTQPDVTVEMQGVDTSN